MFTEDEKKELIRLLFVASMQEADRMNQQGVENALFFIKKLTTTRKWQLKIYS